MSCVSGCGKPEAAHSSLSSTKGTRSWGSDFKTIIGLNGPIAKNNPDYQYVLTIMCLTTHFPRGDSVKKRFATKLVNVINMYFHSKFC